MWRQMESSVMIPEGTSGHSQRHEMLMVLDFIVSNCPSELCKRPYLRDCLPISGEALGSSGSPRSDAVLSWTEAERRLYPPSRALPHTGFSPIREFFSSLNFLF